MAGMKGKKHSDETKLKMSAARKRNLSFGEKGERHPNFGEKLSDEQKLKISAAGSSDEQKAEDTRNDHGILAPPSWFQLAWF